VFPLEIVGSGHLFLVSPIINLVPYTTNGVLDNTHFVCLMHQLTKQYLPYTSSHHGRRSGTEIATHPKGTHSECTQSDTYSFLIILGLSSALGAVLKGRVHSQLKNLVRCHVSHERD
jgi:hypothetical protein